MVANSCSPNFRQKHQKAYLEVLTANPSPLQPLQSLKSEVNGQKSIIPCISWADDAVKKNGGLSHLVALKSAPSNHLIRFRLAESGGSEHSTSRVGDSQIDAR